MTSSSSKRSVEPRERTNNNSKKGEDQQFRINRGLAIVQG